MKYNIDRLPEVSLSSYDDSSMDLAFVVPLFDATSFRSISFEFIKSSLVMAKSLMLNTNLIEKKVPIYYFLEDRVCSLHHNWLVGHGVKAERILSFTALPSSVMYRRISKKMYVIDDPILRQYRNYVVMDADSFASCKPALDKKLDVSVFEGDQLGLTSCRQSETPITLEDYSWWFNKWEGCNTNKEHWDRSESELHRINPDLTFTSCLRYFTPANNFIRFPKHLPQGFREFVWEYEPIVGDDEALFCLWTTFLGGEVDSINPSPMIWVPSEMYEVQDRMPYWCHINSFDEKEQSWEPDFRLNTGAYEILT